MNLIEAIPLSYSDFKFWYLNNGSIEEREMRLPYGGQCGLFKFAELTKKCEHPEIFDCHNCEQYMSPEDIFAFLDMTHKNGPVDWGYEFDENGEIVNY